LLVIRVNVGANDISRLDHSTSAGGAAEGSQAQTPLGSAAPGLVLKTSSRPEGAFCRPFRAGCVLRFMIQGQRARRARPWLPSAAPPALVCKNFRVRRLVGKNVTTDFPPGQRLRQRS
jgi:hypothetical protein